MSDEKQCGASAKTSGVAGDLGPSVPEEHVLTTTPAGGPGEAGALRPSSACTECGSTTAAYHAALATLAEREKELRAAKRETVTAGDRVRWETLPGVGTVLSVNTRSDGVIIAVVQWDRNTGGPHEHETKHLRRERANPVVTTSCEQFEEAFADGFSAAYDWKKVEPALVEWRQQHRERVGPMSAIDAFAKSTGLSATEAAQARVGDIADGVLHVPDCACRLRIKEGHFAGCPYIPAGPNAGEDPFDGDKDSDLTRTSEPRPGGGARATFPGTAPTPCADVIHTCQETTRPNVFDMACAACVDSLRVVGRCQGDGGCETAATSCNYGHRLVRRQDAPSSRPTPENTPGRTPGMAQADCRNCNGHAACAFHGATPTPSPALGNPYVNADGWEDPALLFAAAAEEVIGIGEDGMTVILEDGRWAIMTIREARFAHERTRQVTTMNCPHACVVWSAPSSGATRKDSEKT